MPAVIDEIVAQVQKLTADEREVLRQRLLPILDLPDPEIEAAWIAEAERRSDAIERGEMRTIPWEAARKRLGL